MSRNTVVCLAGLALLAACDKDTGVVQSVPSGVAFVTVANATPNVTKPPLYGTTAVGTANLQAASWMQACMNIPGGSNTVQFKALADTVIATSAATSFTAGQRYTAILAANGATSKVIVAPETFVNLTQGNYGVRIVNATDIAGDFYITASNTSALGASNLAAAGLAAGDLTGGASGTGGYLTHRADTAFVRMYAAGNTTTQQASVNLAGLTTTDVTWTMGTTAIFYRDASNKIQVFTIAQCSPQ